MSSLLIEVGEALYGPRWQSSLAAALDVSDRTVRRWVSGQELPPGIYADLLGLVRKRGAALDRLAGKLRNQG